MVADDTAWVEGEGVLKTTEESRVTRYLHMIDACVERRSTSAAWLSYKLAREWRASARFRLNDWRARNRVWRALDLRRIASSDIAPQRATERLSSSIYFCWRRWAANVRLPPIPATRSLVSAFDPLWTSGACETLQEWSAIEPFVSPSLQWPPRSLLSSRPRPWASYFLPV